MDWTTLLSMLWDYRFVIIGVILIIVYGIMNPATFKAKLYALMLDAKDLAKNGVLATGKAQEDWVVSHAADYLGKRFAIILKIMSEEQLRALIKKLYDGAMDLVDDGKVNGSTTSNTSKATTTGGAQASNTTQGTISK